MTDRDAQAAAGRMTPQRLVDIGRFLSECETEPYTQAWRGIVRELLDALAAPPVAMGEDAEQAELISDFNYTIDSLKEQVAQRDALVSKLHLRSDASEARAGWCRSRES